MLLNRDYTFIRSFRYPLFLQTRHWYRTWTTISATIYLYFSLKKIYRISSYSFSSKNSVHYFRKKLKYCGNYLNWLQFPKSKKNIFCEGNDFWKKLQLKKLLFWTFVFPYKLCLNEKRNDVKILKFPIFYWFCC